MILRRLFVGIACVGFIFFSCRFYFINSNIADEQLEKERIMCRDSYCAGDVFPTIDSKNLSIFKIDNQWFVIPREYGGYGGAFGFRWPSKLPMNKVPRPGEAPELIYGEGGRVINGADVDIDIFLRSRNLPEQPYGYRMIILAERNNWIANRQTLKAGLEKIEMKHVIGPNKYYIDSATYYVATEMRGLDGLPPVATCDHVRPEFTGGTGFIWLPGIWVDTRMNQRHCLDWPEIYTETMRILNLIKKVK